MSEGYYMYGIIGTNEARDFGPMGIGGRGDTVSTISFEDISTVVSMTPVIKYDLSRENLLAHQRVIEEVMKEYTVLPVRFCTVAESAEDIRGVLRKRHSEFKGLLRDMDNKVELGVKILWRDIKAILNEIAEGEKDIRSLRERLASISLEKSYQERIALGKMVQRALEVKKEREAEGVLDTLRQLAVETKLNKVHGDSMVLNAAFLVDGGRVRDFDGKISELSSLNDGMIFKYVGPVPPFNFVNIVVEWR